MALTTRPLTAAADVPNDDYIIETERQEERPSVVARTLHVAQLILFGVVAILTLAVFWVIGLLVGLF